MNNYAFVGIVHANRFRPLVAEHETTPSMRLTTVAAQSAQPPEVGEISLSDYEGSALFVRGIDNGEWICSAVVVEQAGAILTVLVQEVFGGEKKMARFRIPNPLA